MILRQKKWDYPGCKVVTVISLSTDFLTFSQGIERDQWHEMASEVVYYFTRFGYTWFWNKLILFVTLLKDVNILLSSIFKICFDQFSNTIKGIHIQN